MQENEKISEACARAATREVLRAIFDNESRFDEALFQWAYNVMKFDDNQRDIDKYELTMLIQ